MKKIIWPFILIGAILSAQDLPSGPNDTQAQPSSASDLTDACDRGNTSACFDLGIMYVRGKGVGKDVDRAKELFEKACHGGDLSGCKNYAVLDNDRY